jgi:Uma2 family endonuclease
LFNKLLKTRPLIGPDGWVPVCALWCLKATDLGDNAGMGTTALSAEKIPQDRLWRMPVDRYHHMIQSGLITAEDRVELLEGVLVEKMSINPGHRVATRRTADHLRASLPAGWYVDEAAPLTTSDSEPEPDVAVIRGATTDYLDRHPGPGDVAVVIEVSESSLRRDRETNRRIYARAGVREFWLLDLTNRRLEVHTRPEADTFSLVAVIPESGTVELHPTGQRLRIAEFLPPGKQ